MKKYKGNQPESGEGYVRIGKVVFEGMDWLIFRKGQEHSEDWATYKIVADGMVEKKANYWLVRNDKNGKIGFGRDYAIMRNERSGLHLMVEKILGEQ